MLRFYSFHWTESYPEYELVEKVPIEKPLKQKEKYRIERDMEGTRLVSIYDENDNKILSLEQDVYKFEDHARFAVSENGITVFNSFEKPYTPAYKNMIKWVDKEGNVINTVELKKYQIINPYYIADRNRWLIFTELNNFYEIPSYDPNISLGGILVFDESGNKTNQIDIQPGYDNFSGYSTNKTGELIVASFYESSYSYSDNLPRYPKTIVFNINGGFSQEFQISHRGVFSEDNELYHSVRSLVDVRSGEVIFRSEEGYHAFPASKETGIIAIIDHTYFKVIDYRNKKLLFQVGDKRNAKILYVSPDASEIIIHADNHAFKYKRKKQ